MYTGYFGAPGRPGRKGYIGRDGATGATGATGLEFQTMHRRVARAAGCPGKLQYQRSI